MKCRVCKAEATTRVRVRELPDEEVVHDHYCRVCFYHMSAFFKMVIVEKEGKNED